MDKHYSTNDLLEIMATLRAPDGCPWDQEQTHESLKPFLIEEAYELIDAIDSGDDVSMTDELGDVLLQVIFHAQVAAEDSRFNYDDVVQNLCEKLVRRHPHVFDTAEVEDADGVVKQWNEIKKEEKSGKERESLLDGVPRHLPSLMKATKLQKRAAKVGFDWRHAAEVIEKIEEEVGELHEAIDHNDPAHIEEELGDLLFAVVNLSRFLDVDAEDAMTKACRKFYFRFREIEKGVAASGRDFSDFTIDELEEFWQIAKKSENRREK